MVVLVFKECILFVIVSYGDKFRMFCDAVKKIFLASYSTVLLCFKGIVEVLLYDLYVMIYICRRYVVLCVDVFL